MDTKELRLYLKEKFNIPDTFVIKYKYEGSPQRSLVPAYRVLDWLQAGYELGREEAQAKSQS